MQATYAMLMQLCELRATNQISPTLVGISTSTERLVEELRHGLEEIIVAMTDFASSFEAIGGMRGQ